MRAGKPTADEWECLLDDLDLPSYSKVTQTLANARDLSWCAAEDLVDDALQDGILVEDLDAGTYGVIRFAGDCDNRSTEPDSADENTTPDADASASPDAELGAPTAPEREAWSDADFSTPESGVWPSALLEREQWMGHIDKKPFAPWADRDHADAASDEDARWKWGITENYVDGETISMAEDDHRLDGRAFLQQPDDPFLYVDGDDVRDPETREIHPTFIEVLNELGLTYADISQSDAGVHAIYKGGLPEGVKQASWQLDDEPWGANDDLPSIEIYPGKRVCVMTGEHVPGTPTEVRECDEDGLEAVLEEHDQLPSREKDPSNALEDFDAQEYDPGATTSDETTDDRRDQFYAIDRLDAQRVATKTIVKSWNDDASTSEGERAFIPTWGSNSDNGTANIVNADRWQDTGDRGGYGGPVCMAAIDCPDLSITDRDCPGKINGQTWVRAVDHLRNLGFDIPEYHPAPDDDSDAGDEEYAQDPREIGATVDPRRAWDAAGRVTPDDLDGGPLQAAADDPETFACPHCGDPVDVVRAVALEEDLLDHCHDTLDEEYPTAYQRAREQYGAPLLEYYTTGDAIAEFEAVLDVIGEVTFWHLDTDALNSEITARDSEVGGDAVRALDPAWRDSESGESVFVFEFGTVWDADTERVLDALRFVALDSGLIDDPTEPLEGELFTTAYGRARRQYGAPLPRWEPAGAREVTPQLPASEELLDGADLDGVDPDALEAAREEVEELIAAAVDDAETPSVVTSLPATGKTTGTVKLARETPLSYLAARKELQQQAVEKASEWGVSAQVLPVLSEQTVRDELLGKAIAHVRERGKDRLRDRWAILAEVFDDDNDADPDENADDEDDSDAGGSGTPDLGDIFAETEADEVDLDRATCPTAEGEHGVAWALAVHVARKLGYTPQEIHTEATGLFGAEMPCTEHDGDCPYSTAWDAVTDPGAPADLLIGSYGHAHVESVRTVYERDESDTITRRPRPVVLDEFPGQAFETEYGEEAFDFATWLASCLREDVADRRDMYGADLYGDEWVRSWLDGEGGSADAVGDVIDTLDRIEALFDAREGAADILDVVDAQQLEDLNLQAPLEAVGDSQENPADAFNRLQAAIGRVPPDHPGSGVVRWVERDVADPLASATFNGSTAPGTGAVDIASLPIGRDLATLVERAVEAVEDRTDGARELLQVAVVALQGGRDGCRALAAWANDGYAHPNAHHLLQGVITPTDDEAASARRVATSSWAFDSSATDGTVVDWVKTGEKATVVVDRNDHGAVLRTPPARVGGHGGDVPVVGLDATGRRELWAQTLGEPVETVDIHETPSERAAFLEDTLNLHVIRAGDRPRPYEGDPASKDTDGDVALLQAVAGEYAGIEAPRKRGQNPVPVGNPATITTKSVRQLLEADRRLEDIVAEWENYGNFTGANDLGEHRLGVILGSQHFGDDAVERFAALAGREVDTSRAGGRGGDLDYGDDLANAYLNHMREDQVMQAALRFTRGESGATVVARTSALRDDLPVVGRGQVVDTWNDTATKIAHEYRQHGDEFTVGDVVDAVDVTARQVRRILAELAEAGYVQRVETGDGVANVYDPVGVPAAGEVELPARDQALATGDGPGQTAHNQSYTWNVRVPGRDPTRSPQESATRRVSRAPPSPTTAETRVNEGDRGSHDPA